MQVWKIDVLNVNYDVVIVVSKNLSVYLNCLFFVGFSDGSIVWRYYLPNLAPFIHSTHVFSVLYEQRTVAHFPLPAQCMVLGQSRSSDGCMVYVFNPITGKPVGASSRTGTVLPYKVIQSMILPHTGKRFLLKKHNSFKKKKTCFPCLHSLVKTETNVWENSRTD
mgnify:CR=1 FL=1